MNDNNKSCSRFAVAIGLIASCITIFVFLTGWNNIRDIFGGFNQPSTPEISQPIPSATEPSPQATTIIPSIFPEIIDSGQNYKIEQTCNGSTGIDLYIQVPDYPYGESSEFFFESVVRDIAGNWAFDSGGDHVGYSFSAEGIESADLQSGNVAITERYNSYSVNLLGYWGNALVQPYNTMALIAPIQDSCRTKVTLLGGKLQIGFLNPGGTKALAGMMVNIFCQTKDMAGNKTYDKTCPNIGDTVQADSTGTATFYLGPGTYYIEYADNSMDLKFTYDIYISAGETKQILVNYP